MKSKKHCKEYYVNCNEVSLLKRVKFCKSKSIFVKAKELNFYLHTISYYFYFVTQLVMQHFSVFEFTLPMQNMKRKWTFSIEIEELRNRLYIMQKGQPISYTLTTITIAMSLVVITIISKLIWSKLINSNKNSAKCYIWLRQSLSADKNLGNDMLEWSRYLLHC